MKKIKTVANVFVILYTFAVEIKSSTIICGDNWHDGSKNSLKTIEARIEERASAKICWFFQRKSVYTASYCREPFLCFDISGPGIEDFSVLLLQVFTLSVKFNKEVHHVCT